MSEWRLNLGAQISEKGTHFKVWAPFHSSLSVEVVGKKTYPMKKEDRGYFTLDLNEVGVGDTYYYVLENGLKRPDPVSCFLPHGVHGPTAIIDPKAFQWEDGGWKGITFNESIFYEIHVGTFTPSGTFDGVIEKLPLLKKLGVNVIEIMPVAEFPGRWNWGYDGSSPYAPFSRYGGVEGFKRLVNAAHKEGIAVCLDVVYNHLGPEGNYLEEFGPYFSQAYHTLWGKAFNYDGPYSDFVREYIIKNALYWISEYHLDALRIDAIHGIYDFSATPMLFQLREEVEKLVMQIGRKVHVIAESDLNDSRVVRAREKGGWAFTAVWNDDFHHATHVALTGEKTTYYQDFSGIADIAKAMTQGFVYDGKYSSFRKRHHGNCSMDIPLDQFVIFTQNHDQVGNRPRAERLGALIDNRLQKVEACLLLMTPSIPLIFMGQEYGEKAPFEYFVDYSDENLMRSIYEGRKREFHREDMPFPGADAFERSHLNWPPLEANELFTFYRSLIVLRKTHSPKREIKVYYSIEERWLAWEYQTKNGTWVGVFCYLAKGPLDLPMPFTHVKGQEILLSTEKIEVQSNRFFFPFESVLIIS